MLRVEDGAIIILDRGWPKNGIFGQHCVVKGNIEFGEDVIIGSLALVEGTKIKIGNRTKIMPFAAIGSNTEIGEDCFIGPYFAMANAAKPAIGKMEAPTLESLKIGDRVVIGTSVKIEPGVTIGDDVSIHMGAHIKKNMTIPSNSIVRSDGSIVPRS